MKISDYKNASNELIQFCRWGREFRDLREYNRIISGILDWQKRQKNKN